MLPTPIAMHIPDGFLSVPVSILFWLVTVGVVGYTLRRVSIDLGERQVPIMGVLAAAIFAGQMLNFAVAGGTSGHFLGAALATIILGPWAATLVLTCVITVQALIFQDGGLLVLGANIFNMAIVGVAVAYMTFRTTRRLVGERPWGLYASGFLAAWTSVVIAALGTALELSLSGTSPANLAIPAMGGIHALIGIGEGLITVGALTFLRLTRGDLLKIDRTSPVRGNLVWVIGLALALLLAIASPLASKHPDGLISVATQYGFINNAQGPVFKIIPHYLFPGVENKALATILAALLGTCIVFIVALSIAYTRRHRPASDNQPPGSSMEH
ncbi:MAG TPA: energy-coupling factor ABC transporter permease [Anaerolineales bacterium]|nr:energy-coupling factor ABC transporter permease [Anaerolineales bacterium]